MESNSASLKWVRRCTHLTCNDSAPRDLVERPEHKETCTRILSEAPYLLTKNLDKPKRSSTVKWVDEW